jgi:hypothetical protein
MARRVPRYIREAETERDPPHERRIPADISQHAPHTSYVGGPLLYEDKKFKCVDCGDMKVWSAEEQKWWYETAKGHVFSEAKRCSECRQLLVARHGGTPRKSRRDRRSDADT